MTLHLRGANGVSFFADGILSPFRLLRECFYAHIIFKISWAKITGHTKSFSDQVKYVKR